MTNAQHIEACLIAAAPQLLAECLRAEGELCSALQVGSSEHMTVDMMRAWLKGVRSAIAKATLATDSPETMPSHSSLKLTGARLPVT